ncbi:hypothetical protein XENORESO_002772 [Xenotaenia resolanae]|uniref:Uncharacterized protein n=1 Tax=Xenotaenia resolanae TaxID=208358 RepID=A0ABV0WUM9_9TELE
MRILLTGKILNSLTFCVSFRPPLADTWYSLSYVYFSLFGMLTTMIAGLLLSIITGGCKQKKMNSDLFVRKSDLICFRGCRNSKESDEMEKAPADLHMGVDNKAFTAMDVMSKGSEHATKL